MLLGRFILAVSLVLVSLDPVRSETNGEQDASRRWPPPWLEGMWENESTVITYNGEPSSKSFSCAKYYIFVSGYRFSVFDGRRVSATPMLGHTQHDDVLHCLFKMTRDRPAMRAEFTGRDETAEYLSYLISSTDGRRYKFVRKLKRVANDHAAIKVAKATFEKDFYSPHSDSAREILEQWIRDHEQSPAD